MKNQGFSLIELMVTIAIVAILLTIGLPSFQDTIKSNQIDTATNNLFRDFNFTRSESIKRGESISICPSTDSASCADDSLYGQGWIVFVDSNENGAVDGEELIRAVDSPSDTLSMSGNLNFLCYNPNGLLC